MITPTFGKDAITTSPYTNTPFALLKQSDGLLLSLHHDIRGTNSINFTVMHGTALRDFFSSVAISFCSSL